MWHYFILVCLREFGIAVGVLYHNIQSNSVLHLVWFGLRRAIKTLPFLPVRCTQTGLQTEKPYRRQKLVFKTLFERSEFVFKNQFLGFEVPQKRSKGLQHLIFASFYQEKEDKKNYTLEDILKLNNTEYKFVLKN